MAAGAGLLGALPAILGGCGSGESSAEKGPGQDFTGALGVLIGSHMEPVREMGKMYAERHDVQPKLEQVTTPDLRSKVTTTFLSRRSPWDSVFVTAELAPELADKGWLVAAGDTIGKVQDEGPIMQRALGAATYEGTTYAVPWTIGCPILHWNKRALSDADLDPEAPARWHETENSWDAMVEFAKKTTDPDNDVYGYTDAWAGTHVLFTWGSLLQMHGGSFFDEEGQPAMDSEAGVAATEKLVDLLHTHKVVDPAATTYTWVFDASPGFLNGNRTFFISWPFIANLASTPEESKIAGDSGFAPNPAVETSASVDGSEFFSVPTFAENDDEAWRFIELVSSVEGQRLAAQAGWAPMYEELLRDEALLEKFPVYDAVRQSYEYPVDGGWTPDRPMWTKVLSDEISQALGQKKSPAEAMQAAVKQINSEREG